MAATPRRSGESPSEYRRRLEQLEWAATTARRGRLVRVPSSPVRRRAAPPARQEIRIADSITPAIGPVFEENTAIKQDYSALEERVLASTPRWRAIWERMKQAWRDI